MLPNGDSETSRADRSIDFHRHNYSRGIAQTDKNLIIQDSNVYEDSFNKFQKISDNELVADGQLKKSRQAIIAGKLLRIRQEIKQLD